MEKQQPMLKILMFPWLAHGHIHPFLELAKTLPSTTFTIYLCSTRVNLDSLKPRIEKEFSAHHSPSIELVELHVPSSPELPPEMYTTRSLSSDRILTLMKAFQMSSLSFSEILNSVEPDLLIYDYFQPWAPKLALSKGIPSVLFSTSGATPFCFHHHFHTMGNTSPFPSPAIYLLDVEKFDWRTDCLMKLVKDAEEEEFAFGNFALSTDIVLVKTPREVEAKYIDYLSVLCKKRIVATGPLVVDANDDDEHSEIMKWLAGKKECSTVYISFGSEYFLSKEEMTELAKGLLLLSDEVNFLWVVRFPNGETTTSVEEALPKGFLETVKGRGRVIEEWAPQTKILAHPSIGGFTSHCGWSSVMESMYFGVPIIGMPMKSDQPLNARFAAEVGVGVVVEKDGDGCFKGVEVARAMHKVMVESEFSGGVRERAVELSQRIRENAEEERNAIGRELLRICMKKTQM